MKKKIKPYARLEALAANFSGRNSSFKFSVAEVCGFLQKAEAGESADVRQALQDAAGALEPGEYSPQRVGRVFLRVCTDLSDKDPTGGAYTSARIPHPMLPEAKREAILADLSERVLSQRELAAKHEVDVHVVQRLRSIYYDAQHQRRDAPLSNPVRRTSGRPKRL
jgi:hypothetical protein